MISTTLNKIDLLEIDSIHKWDRLFLKARLKILFVTDSRFTDTNSVYEYMDGKSIGCTNYRIDRALYTHGNGALQIDNTPGPNDPHYGNFKFASVKPGGGRVIDDYHVIFIFAVNSGSSIPDTELQEIHAWMNNGGGVFATGDHDTLGESLCTKIPRVATMRKWSDADDVPPGSGVERIDTNQPDPTNPGQVAGTTVIPNAVQGDAYPQKITWLADRIQYLGGWKVIKYPHEVLCHPQLGPIDLMPDHPHEGECVNPATIDITNNIEFGAADEYPAHSVSGRRERPQIIAKGRTSSQYTLAKGPVDPLVFNMISVYDGHKSEVGRVVVDSTWHHWYGMNIDGLIASGGTNWEKIGQYFLNVAKYLAPEGVFRERCWFDILDAQFKYPFVEEQLATGISTNLYELGRTFEETLVLRWGSCGVLSFVINHICQLKPNLCKLIEEVRFPPFNPDDPRFPPGPDPICLTCPPFEVISAAALGGIIRGTASMRKKLQTAFVEGKASKGSISVDEIQKLALNGMAEALDEVEALIKRDLSDSLELFSKDTSRSKQVAR